MFACCIFHTKVNAVAQWEVEKVIDVARVTAGFPVRFCLLTDDNRQYVAYYDTDHQMTIASRMLESEVWTYQKLPSTVGWDSHNYITMAIDSQGQLHVSGNMHADKLVYFRTVKAADITTLQEAPMVGELENKVTYPKFLTNRKGDLIYTYRHGGSGNGVNPYNIYNPSTQSWTRFFETSLFDGEGKINAYPTGPTRGPVGWFHAVWVWRDTPDCATNHDLSYARSRDLIHWESAFGDKVELPIRIGHTELCVDPIPSHGGIINGCPKLFFDSKYRPVINYHKSDENGNMQIYAARPENGKWNIYQLTDWDQRIEFSGGGSMGFIGIKISGLEEAAPGLLTMTYRHRDFGNGRLFIDEETLKPSEQSVELLPEFPAELSRLESNFPGLGVQRISDIGDSGDPMVRYVIKWETLGRNRDRKRETSVGPSMLKLYKLKLVEDNQAAAFFESLDLTRPELSKVAHAVKIKDWKVAKDAWAEHLSDRTSPHWHWSHRNRKTIQNFLYESGDDLSSAVKRADKVLRREFSMQGKKRTLPKNIEWESDSYGYEWGNVLNRHHYWRYLGLSWWRTGDPKYAQDWVYMMSDWVKDNPPAHVKAGPWRSLEAGMRPGNWIDLMYMFMDAPAFDAEAKYLFTRAMRDHAMVLYNKNKTAFRNGNWGQTEASGLLNISIMFPEFKQAPIWRKRSFELITQHVKRSIFDDGAYSELTPNYHYWMTISFMKIQTLAKKNGMEIPGFSERHEKMFEFLMQVSTPDRRFIPVGDAGSGKDIGMIMGMGALLYNRPDMRYLAIDEIDPSWIWSFPPEQLAKYKTMEQQVPSLSSHMMPHAQFGVMRTGWNKEDRSLLFDCAQWGGPHSHEDRLQVTLYSGRDLLLDSGQSNYGNPLAFHYFRRSKAHNVLMIDGKAQPDSNPKVLSWNVDERLEFASGIIKNQEFSHQRSVLFVKPDYWVVVDHVTGNDAQDTKHSLSRLFHFPDVEVSKTDNSVQTRYEAGDNLWIGCADGATIDMQKGFLSKALSKKPKTPVAAFVNKQDLPATLCSVLVPFGEEKEIPKVERLPSDGSGNVAIRVSFADGREDWIAIASKDAALSAGSYSGNGIALCARVTQSGTTLNTLQERPLPK
jgi:hypothetical protein